MVWFVWLVGAGFGSFWVVLGSFWLVLAGFVVTNIDMLHDLVRFGWFW